MSVRRRALVAALLLVVAAVGVPVAAADSAEAYVTVGSVSVTPDSPAVGEYVTVTATFENAESSTSSARITEVGLHGPSVWQTAHDVGKLGPGGSVTVPFSVAFEEPGQKRLTVDVRGFESDGQSFTAQKPVYVDVGDAGERLQLSLEPSDLVAGEETAVNVTVANGESAAVSGVGLTLRGPGATVEDPTRVSGSIPSGGEREYAYNVTVAAAGTHRLEAALNYSQDGTRHEVRKRFDVDVEEPAVDAELTATPAETNGSAVIRASLTEYGNVELRDVQFRALVDGAVVARSLGPDVPTDQTRRVELDGSDVPAGDVTVVAEYTAAGERRESRTSFRYSPVESSSLALTGVEVTRTGSRLTLSGDVANVGSADANSVLVSVVGTGDVTPVPPNREYFVGAVGRSEFATFELTANASADAGAVPVRISYTADGERLSRVVDVDVSNAAGTSADGANGRGGSPVVPLVGGLLALALIAGGVALYRRRKRRSERERER